jgi:hypothetical protein
VRPSVGPPISPWTPRLPLVCLLRVPEQPRQHACDFWSGLASSTTYHLQAMSRDSSGFLGASGDFTFTTTGNVLSPLFLLHADATEVSGVTNGSAITPAVAPAGFTGTVAVNGTGSLNYTPAQSENRAFFLNCCSNNNTAHYKTRYHSRQGLRTLDQRTQSGEQDSSLRQSRQCCQHIAHGCGARWTICLRSPLPAFDRPIREYFKHHRHRKRLWS